MAETLQPLGDTTYRDSVISNCTELLPEWVDLKTRVERTAGLDRQLTNRYDLVYKQMDRYLQQLFILNVGLGEGDGNVTA